MKGRVLLCNDVSVGCKRTHGIAKWAFGLMAIINEALQLGASPLQWTWAINVPTNFVVHILHFLKSTNMETVRWCRLSCWSNVVGMCSSVDYAQNWVIIWYNYWFNVLATISIWRKVAVEVVPRSSYPLMLLRFLIFTLRSQDHTCSFVPGSNADTVLWRPHLSTAQSRQWDGGHDRLPIHFGYT